MLQIIDRKYAQSRELLAHTRKETTEEFAVTTCAEHPELFEAAINLEREVWDEFSFLEHTSAHHAHYEKLRAFFPEYHLCMIDLQSREVVATGVCVPLRVLASTELPREGWDWVVNTASEQRGKHANTISALAISVPEQYRHKGLARDMINTMRALAAMKDISNIIAPVRPSAKCRHPFVAMEEYVEWRDERGRMFDPWLRSHVAVGGKVISVCDRSMVVERPIDFWRPWTWSNLDQDGRVPVKGALAPLEIDVGSGVGRYVEPNVWVRHTV
jgi:hypothetical protein